MKKAINSVTCPNCGNIVSSPLNLIAASQIKKTAARDDIAVDETLSKFIESYGGIMPSEDFRKQITYENGNIPECIKKHIKGNKLILQIGMENIDQKACPHCHSNITPLYRTDIERVVNVLLVGMPGSSKTCLTSSISKLITDRTINGKDDRIIHGASPKSYEYTYYANIGSRYPEIEPATVHLDGFYNRQPLFYCVVHKTLIIFHDFPGEALKSSEFYIPDNAIPVYLYDTSIKDDEQLSFFTTKIMELHDGGRTYDNEYLTFVKCDILDDEFVQGIMLKEYDKSNFKEFSGLFAARRMAILDSNFAHPIYCKLRNYCQQIDVSCIAALGCGTHAKGDHFELDSEWAPMFLYDFLLSLGGSK